MKNKITVSIILAFVLSLSLWNLVEEKQTYSESERRVLAQMPELGEDFADDWETYAADHFPMREWWRSVKSYVNAELFQKKDHHGLYQAGGHLSEIEYPMNEQMLDHALASFEEIKKTYLSNQKIYLAVIPDKNRYLAEEYGYLHMDYEAFSKYMEDGMPYASYIEIADLLEAEDYYNTDIHWKQENLVDVAKRIARAMGTKVSKSFEKNVPGTEFRGVYAGQYARKCEPDEIVYLSNKTIDRFRVEGAADVYDMEKGTGKDPYELFLSGNQPIITIKNKQNESGKRLIVFRDSFGSALAPLVATGYEEVVLIDLRYVSKDMLSELVNFKNADILFLYSTTTLNRAKSMNL